MANHPVRVVIQGQISVDAVTAELLQYLCSFDLQKYFAQNCGSKFTAERLQEATRELRFELARITRAQEAAEKAIIAEFTPKPAS